MKRFFLFCFLCVTLFLVFGLSVVNAEEVILGSGSCGANLTWTLSSTGELRISGTGDMQNYPYISAPWYELRNEITSIVIESGVTSIGDSVFQDCTNLTSITIPEGITYIGSTSFSNCINLLGIDLPESLVFLGDAFYLCNKLTEITIPGNVLTVGGGAFVNCSGLTTVKISEGVTTIDIVAFSGCDQITTINLPLSLSSINNNAFWSCNRLESVFYNGTAEQWADITFGTGNDFLLSATRYYGAPQDEFGTISVGLVQNGQLAMSSLFSPWGETITVTASPDPGYALAVIQVDGVNIAGNTFVVSGNHVVTATFEVKTLTLSVGDVVNGQVTLSNLSTLYGSTVTVTATPNIGYELGNIQVDGVNIEGNTFVVISGHVVTATFTQNGVLLASGTSGNIEWGVFNTGHLLIRGSGPMPGGSPWSDYSYLISSLEILDGVISIGDSAFYGCRSLRSAIIPGSITSIGSSAFSGCSSLTSLPIPNSVTSIGGYAFSDCRSLIGIIIPEGVNVVWDYTFSGCSSLLSVAIPNSVTSIRYQAFRDCRSLINITIPSSVTSIGSNAFDGCISLASVIIPSSVTSLGDNAFSYCSSLESISIPNSVTAIDGGTFYGCSSLKNIILPTNLTYIGHYAFYGCSSLTNIILPTSLTYIGQYAFYGCSGLENITIPNGITMIWEYTFSGCHNLKSVTIPSSVTTVWDNAFSGCGQIGKVFYNGAEGNWEKIFFEIGNETLTNATRYYGAPEDYRNITIGSVSNGSIELSNSFCLVGSTVTVTATPNSGYELVNIQVDGINIEGNTFVVSSDHIVTAIFELKTFTATVGTIENGQISLSNQMPQYGSTVTVTATPNTNYNLVGIQVDGVNIAGNIFFVANNHVVTATFELKTFTATVGAIDNGQVLLSNQFPEYGSTVTVTATPNPGYKLTTIQVDGINIEGNTFVVSSDHVVTATFELKTFTATVVNSVNGQISLSNQGPQYGSTVTVTTTPNTGYTLVGIQVDGVNIAGNTFVVSGNHVVTATFELRTFSLTLGTTVNGQVSLSNQFPQYGSTITVTATSNIGYELESIQVDRVAIEGNTFVVSDNHVVTATFAQTGILLASGSSSNIEWGLFDTGHLLIRGTGPMPDYSNYGSPWYSYKSVITSVEILNGVTSIGEFAFSYCNNLTSITIPSSVNSIGYYAFFGCVSLINITIPSSVNSIGAYAFYGCRSMINITIPSGVTSIENRMFSGCSNLSDIVIPSGVTAIGLEAFYGCGSLTNIVIPSSVTYIDINAFIGCYQLGKVFFDGVVDGWAEIYIEGGNESLVNATRYYGLPEDYRNITIGSVSNGSIELSNSFCLVSSTVTVTATPKIGYELANIQVDGVNIEGNTFVVTSDHVVTATFELKTFTATVGNIENGQISLSNQAPLYGSTVTVTATPNTNYNLVGIQVDGVNIAGNTFVVYGDHVVTATFELKTFTMTVGTSDNGQVSLSNQSPQYGSTVTVTATPNIGCELVNIQIDGVDIEGNTFVVSGDHVVSAIFKLKTFTATVGNIDNGQVYLSNQMPQYGSTVTVTATPNNGYQLMGIQVDGINLEGNTFMVSGNHVVTATFELRTFALTLGAAANGQVSLSNQFPQYGSTVTVTATSNIGYELESIQVDGVNIEGNTFVVSDNHVVSVAFAQNAVLLASGSCGVDVSWGLFDTGHLVIRGTGPMYDYYDANMTPWNRFWTEIKSVEIMNGVTTVGNYSFANCRNLANVTIPNSVTTIGGFAFIGCSSLPTVVIPDSVTVIMERAFYACTNLTSIVIPNGVTTIGGYAFYGCSNLASIAIPESVTTIGSDTFAFCTSLTSIVIPEGVTSIESSTFYNCINLISVTIPRSVTSIGEYAFYACGSLTNVVIPGNVAWIGNNAFASCENLSKVTFEGNAPTAIGVEVFPSVSAGGFLIYYSSGKTGWISPLWKGYYSTALDTNLVDYSVLDANNTNIQGVVFTLNDQSNTASVGDNSANNNNSGYYGAQFGKVVIPAIVTKSTKSYKVIGVGQNAFSNNKLLTSIELGENITSIDTTAFSNCSSLASFVVSPSNTQFKAVDGILFDTVSYYLYLYPSAKSGSTYTVPDTVRTIGTKAFFGNKNLININVPNSVTGIGLGAFEACSNLKTITLPFIGRNVTSQDTFGFVFGSGGAWDNRVPASLESIIITGGSLKPSSFENLANVKNLTLQAMSTTIPSSSFKGCSSLESLIFTGINALPELGQVILPDQVTSIEDYAFYGCSGLESIIIPQGVTAIGYQAFSGCTSLESFSVDENNLSYRSDMWGVLFTKDLSTLICYPSSRVWPYYNVPNQTTTLLAGAFNACANLVNLYIPSTVTNLGDSSISNCPGVTICVYLSSPADTYAGNNNLTAWYMDNYTLQGIEIYSLPEQMVYPLGQEDFSGLYLVANYGGKQLQLDDYELHYNMNLLGLQTVTVEHSAKTASFDIVLFDATAEQVLDFGVVVAPEGTMALVAVYDAYGRMICIESAIVTNSQGKAVISNNEYNKMSKAKLFVLDGLNLAPQRQEYRIQK